jgi:hypothetical protein|tara:strand:+ start:332 stop:484 length:153 start_codon:yes stop_codon:yes gene_type:complete
MAQEVKPEPLTYPTFLKYEDLDTVLTVLWNSVPKDQQANVVEQFINQELK